MTDDPARSRDQHGRETIAQTPITIDGTRGGRIFEGIDGLSAGASSRLLIDYPEPYRSQILDYLFKPHYGAALHHLKVEIGGDTNSTDGAEPSHMHSRTDECYDRGYEWWLMKEAVARNPHIILDALAWGAPSWIGDGRYYSQDMAEYIVSFIKGAKTCHNLEIAYVGIWNEMHYDKEWIKLFKKTLRAHSLATKVVAADGTWAIVDDMLADPALAAAIDVVGVHYPGSSPVAARELGKPLWSSEDGPWFKVEGSLSGAWPGAQLLAKTYNRNYIEGRLTKTVVWSLVTSYYDNLQLPGSGLMYANSPWSGHYEVQPAIWVTAHTAQFVQPGWQYVDSACGYLAGEGSFVTMKAPNGHDYSIIIETIDASERQTINVSLRESLSKETIHVWRTNERSHFVQLAGITPVNGAFRISLEPGSIYSLTTTTGQGRGRAAGPAGSAFPFPYADDFDDPCSRLDGPPKYFSDQEGSFEIAECTGRSGRCLRQVVACPPIWWSGNIQTPGAPPSTPGDNPNTLFTIIGDERWRDYRVSTDALMEEPGYVRLLGRLTDATRAASPAAYHLSVRDTGAWDLTKVVTPRPLLPSDFSGPIPASLSEPAVTILAEGMVPFSLNAWHTLVLTFSGAHIQVAIDGNVVAEVTDGTHRRGMVGLGTGWNRAQFDKFAVRPLSG